MEPWRAGEHEQLVDRGWDEARALAAIAAIITDAEAAAGQGFWPGHPRDDAVGDQICSLYLGSAGMIWALHRLGSRLDLPALLSNALERYRAKPDYGHGAHPPSLWMGEAGLLVVADRIGSAAADTRRLGDLVHANREHPTWELMWGSPGTALAARVCGLEREWEESASILWERRDDAGLWTQTLYGRTATLLGPPHGFAGNIHALRGCVDQHELRDAVTRVLERTALRADGMINWPPAAKSPLEIESEIRVQWCHGAPGIVTTLADLMPIELALAGGELTWRAGPLVKGAGLCHGTAGNGYAFLRLFALTGEELWLQRARRFAMHAIGQVEAERDRVGRGRYTLWTGDVGVALYLRACLEGDPAFPTIDVW